MELQIILLHNTLAERKLEGCAHCILNNATITPVFEKGGRNSKGNYRPVSILPNISKIFERCIFRISPVLWISFCQNTNVVFAKVAAHNIVY